MSGRQDLDTHYTGAPVVLPRIFNDKDLARLVHGVAAKGNIPSDLIDTEPDLCLEPQPVAVDQAYLWREVC